MKKPALFSSIFRPAVRPRLALQNGRKSTTGRGLGNGQMFSRRHQNAFTIIELYVTVSIIAILASLILPSINRARSRAASIQCVNNQRQMGVAMHLYAADTRYFPSECYFTGGATNKQPIYWFDSLKTYTGAPWGTSVMKCPSYKWYTDAGGPDGANGARLPFGSYSFNAHGSGETLQAMGPGYTGPGQGLGNANAMFAGAPGVGEGAVVAPSDMYAIGDASLFHVYTPPAANGQPGGAATYYWFIRDWTINPLTQHADGLNMLLVDGHAEHVSTNHLFSTDLNWRRRWNRSNAVP
jgi:prepilin-type N-terminal cleavage/methylation domain-containing protein/prepilin-type processing-associated H-X9-DG protein